MRNQSKPLIYITEPDEIASGPLQQLIPDYRLVQGDSHLQTRFSPEIEGLLIRSGTRVDVKILNKIPLLKWVIRVGVGVDTIDLDEVYSRGGQVFTAHGANTDAVAEYAVGMMVVALRNWWMISRVDLVEWNRLKMMGRELRHRKVGLVGFGEIGKAVYKRLMLWGCDFVIFDPFVTEESKFRWGLHFVDTLEELLYESQIISLHVPLTRATHHLLSKELLSLLQPGVVLINSARGAVVDEVALIEVMPLKKGIYVADVFETEPVVRTGLLDAEWVIATPHIAAMTEEAHVEMAEEAISNFINGKPIELFTGLETKKKGVYAHNQSRI
jgi:phosphoglycerate dehydrogenase-like enzyme